MIGRFKTLFSDAFRSLHRLALEIVGTFFLALAFFGFGSAFEEYRRYQNAPESGILRFSLSALFVVVMLGFGLHTFWRARKIR